MALEAEEDGHQVTDAGPAEPGSWEQRWHPLREEWVIVAGHRQQRPWIGKTVAAAAAELPAYDPTCYLCPGNARVGGDRKSVV